MKRIGNTLIQILSKKVLFIYLTVILMILCLIPIKVSANEINQNEIIDFSKKGSISVRLIDNLEGTKINGASIKVYQVASAREENNNLTFLYHESLSTCQSELEKGNITNQVLDCIIQSEVPKQEKVTSEEGMISFDNLDLGLYFVMQTNQIEGYANIAPFLIMIPEILDNKWNYDIEASPKIDIIRLVDVTVEKVWNTENDNNIPSQVTIELLKQDEVIDTVVLNSKDNWTYTWENIEKSDEYSVREINIPKGYVANYRREGNKFIVTNTKTLAQTGHELWKIELLTISGILFIATGIVLIKRKKV